MKKVVMIVVLAAICAGCSKEKTMETVADVQDAQVIAPMQQIMVQLPTEMASPVLESEEMGTLYECDDYSVTAQIVESGDLVETIYNATGMDKENLQIIQTMQGDLKRYQWVWAAGADSGIQVGRGCILDDGTYHYVLTSLADEAVAGEVQSAWNEIFSSFRLNASMEDLSTGS